MVPYMDETLKVLKAGKYTSHTTLKQHSKRARLNVYMLKILPVLHLLRSLVIKSGHMATVCIGEGEKPTQASLTQVMT